MAARPRKIKNRGLPPNLYENNGGVSFKYRRPDTGTWHGMGNDRQRAIQAAKQLNSRLMAGSDLVAGVLGETMTMHQFLVTYVTNILPGRDLAKATLELYTIRIRQIDTAMGAKPLDQITIKMIADFLDPMTPRAANQARAILVDVFKHAAAKGLVPDNPAENTIARMEKKTRRRHTIEGLKAIRAKSPRWLQNAIDLALITAQRRSDILGMKFDDVRDGFLYVVQQKTSKASDAAWIRFQVTPQLQAVLTRCRDEVLSPYLIHRKPERLKQKQAQTKDHWTAIEERFLTRAFKDARDAAGCYKGWGEEEMPGFHEVRALSLHLYQRAGREAQQIAGHASADMTKNYQRDHAEVVWSDAVPDLDISEIAS